MRQADGSRLVSGLLRPDEVERRNGVALHKDEAYATVAGPVAKELGRVPAEGDAVRITLEVAGEDPRDVLLTVVELDGLRVDSVHVRTRLPPSDGWRTSQGTAEQDS